MYNGKSTDLQKCTGKECPVDDWLEDLIKSTSMRTSRPPSLDVHTTPKILGVAMVFIDSCSQQMVFTTIIWHILETKFV